MSNQFEMVGRLTVGKETEKFKPYREETFEKSGWMKRKLSFNVISGDNRHMLTVDGGSFKDGHGDVFLFSKNTVNESGVKVKGSKFTIPFKERLTSPRLAECAEFKKFVFDLEKPNRRYLLQKLAEDIHEGKQIIEDRLKEVGLELETEVTDALEKSKKRHHEFVSEWDYAEFVKKVIDSGKYKDSKFKIKGDIVNTYSDDKARFYNNLVPSRIYLAKDDEEEMSTATIQFMYNKDSLDDGSVEEKSKYYINGFTFEYERGRKANVPCPCTIVLNAPNEEADEKTKKAFNMYVKQFTVEDDSWKLLGVVVNMINGSQKVEIDESMLTEFQQEMLMLGEVTLDEIREEIGGNVYGDRVQENSFYKLAKGYSKGREDTAYQDEDFEIKPLEEAVVDIFEEDEDDI